MEDLLNNNSFILVCLICAVFRVYLELINFKFSELPLTKTVFKSSSLGNSFHRTGFILSVGYIILFAPVYLFGS